LKFRWNSDVPPADFTLTPGGWLRAGMRGLCMALVILLGVIITVALRLIERPLHGLHRPWTPYVTQWVSWAVFRK
jgi:1-acyl-sn-glycerol-3-phosphate acyltransferase